MDNKILLGIISIVAIALLIGGGTYAYFSDTEISEDNTFASGTLDLSVDSENAWTTTKISVNTMGPGDSDVATMTLQNIGTLDASSLTVNIDSITDGAGDTPEPELEFGTDNGELSQNMDIVLWTDTDGDGVIDVGESELYNGTLNAATTGPWNVGALTSSATENVSIFYEIDNSVGNVIQGDTCTFNITYILS